MNLRRTISVHARGVVNPDVPLYAWEQIRELIRGRVDDGTYQGKLPAEVDLAAELGVARGTVRHALTDLVAAGVLVSVRGLGYFVARNRP